MPKPEAVESVDPVAAGAQSGDGRRSKRLSRCVGIGVPILLLFVCLSSWRPWRHPEEAAPPDPAMMAWIPLGDAPSIGSPAAPVVIVAFSNFECEYCMHFARETWPVLKQRWVDAGVVRVVFRHLLPPGASMARQVAEVAVCAAEQDAFWSMHDAMFQWGALSEDGAIRRRAAAAGVRLDELDRCQARERAAEQIGRDQDLAHSLQLERAPLFAIGRMEDDQRIRIRGLLYGALPIEQFDKAIRAMGVRSAGQDVAGKAGMEPESKGSWASERRGIP